MPRRDRGAPRPRSTRPGRAPVRRSPSRTTCAVHHDERDALRVLVRPLEGGAVADRLGVEDDEVGLHPRADEPAVGEPQARRGKGRHLPDRLLEGQELLLPHVDAEHPRERPVAAGVGRALPEDRDLPVRGDHRERRGEDALDVLLGDRVEDARGAALLHDLEREVGGVLDGGREAAADQDLGEGLPLERGVEPAGRDPDVAPGRPRPARCGSCPPRPRGCARGSAGLSSRRRSASAPPSSAHAGKSAAASAVLDAVYG